MLRCQSLKTFSQHRKQHFKFDATWEGKVDRTSVYLNYRWNFSFITQFSQSTLALESSSTWSVAGERRHRINREHSRNYTSTHARWVFRVNSKKNDQRKLETLNYSSSNTRRLWLASSSCSHSSRIVSSLVASHTSLHFDPILQSVKKYYLTFFKLLLIRTSEVLVRMKFFHQACCWWF